MIINNCNLGNNLVLEHNVNCYFLLIYRFPVTESPTGSPSRGARPRPESRHFQCATKYLNNAKKRKLKASLVIVEASVRVPRLWRLCAREREYIVCSFRDAWSYHIFSLDSPQVRAFLVKLFSRDLLCRHTPLPLCIHPKGGTLISGNFFHIITIFNELCTNTCNLKNQSCLFQSYFQK